MIRLVLHSNVCLTWFTRGRPDGAESARSIELHRRVRDGAIGLIEPPTWRAEIADSLARSGAQPFDAVMTDLVRIDATIDDSPECLHEAAMLARRLRRRVFDTLYHAAALRHGVALITTNSGYYRAARSLGNIALLRDWTPNAVRERPVRYRLRPRSTPVRCRKLRRNPPSDRAIVGK
ncbi:MAG TPA: PIN domain-containing protein [Rudaea sp.]